ncbi:MAG: murein biosynthesis integral membrane protein MurJ [Desulfatitalea sp.]|nr:murein biosynthesis integral membrane protein MurJ [Desulfatitalea sp.]NNK02148.1 murein biosynthesis integral membrane protein MurJ [Desulfatitalea sp.]
MKAGVGRKVGVATLIMMGSILVSRVLGMLRESVLAALVGAGASVDAYKAAFVLPEILNHILASGFFSVSFIPIFMKYLAGDDEEGGWRLFSTLITVLGAAMVLLVIGSWVAAPQLVKLLVHGRSSDPAFMVMTLRMTRIILPAQLFFFCGGLLMAVQFAKERFLMPALSGLCYNLSIILVGVMMTPWLGIEAFAWGALVGAGLGSFCIQWYGARKVGMRFTPLFDWRHPDLRRYIRLTLPLMFGLTMTFSTEVFSKFFGSFLPAGGIAHVDYAWRIVLALVGFSGQALGVASFPFLARMAAERRFEEMNRLFNSTMRYMALVIPMAVLIFVVRHEVVHVIFERGRFTGEDTRATALALAGMLVGTVAFAAQTVVNRGFYAMQNTLLPALYGSAAVALSLPIYWVGLNYWGVLGIGLAISFSALVQVQVLFAVWNRKSRNRGSVGVYRFFVKIMLLCLPVAALLLLAQHLLQGWVGPPSLLTSFAIIAAQGGLFLLLMAALTWCFDITEVKIVWQKIVARIR